MRPRTELTVAGAVAAALMVLAFAGGRRVRASDDPDRRASSFLAGREGARALADAAERLRVPVVRWRMRPQGLSEWLDANAGGAGRGRSSGGAEVVQPSSPTDTATHAALVIIDPPSAVTRAERDDIVRLVTSRPGADLVLAGQRAEPLARCFGYLVVAGYLDSARVVVPGRPVEADAAFVHDRLAAASDSTMRRNRPEPESATGGADGRACPPVTVTRTDTLLLTTSGRLVMARLTVRPFGRTVLLVGDDALLRNRTLRRSSTGPLVVQSVTARGGPLIFDEYHQGFREGGSMAGVALAWSRRSPLGWMVWQLCVVGLVALAAGAVRFGPVRAAIARERRSPLEHVRALATALASAGGHRTAIAAMVRGLRRRLARDAATGAPRDDWRPWLAGLRVHAPNEIVRGAAERLEYLAEHPESETAVLSAANAVEDLWLALRR